VTALPFPNSATATATAGGFSPQAQTGSGVGFFLNATGAWSAVAAYNPGDVATFNGAAWCNYVAVAAPGPNTSPDLDPTHWLSQGIIPQVYIVSTLPAAPPAYTRAFVTDATAPVFSHAVVGLGAVVCPVYFDGATWLAG
jgi:hypothetical protein